MSRCEPKKLPLYRLGLLLAEETCRLEAHLTECAECAVELANITAFSEAIEARELWPDDELRSELKALTDEDENTFQARVAHIVKTKPADRWWEAFAASGLLTQWSVTGVLAVAESEYDHLPLRNLELCALATRIAEHLAETVGPGPMAGLRFDAWKDRASAHRRCGELQYAMDALKKAERFVPNVDEPPQAQAIVWYAQSIILAELEKLDEAMTKLLQARDIFEECDPKRYQGTFWQEAIIFAERGDYDRAIIAFESLLEDVCARGNRANEADILGNIARCFAEAGQPWSACDYLSRAITANRAVGSRVGELRDTLTLAKILWSVGCRDEASSRFREARQGYAELGMARSIIRVELDFARVCLESGPSTDVYAQFVRLAAECSKLDLPVSLAHVVATLRELATTHRLTLATIDYTIAYLDEVDRSPNSIFTPPGLATKFGVGN